ncbi:MAG: thioredoxin fold domain-containing protein [Pirellulales bacterium]|nr:thioredoxin fold domain-containing protein [Pirellulales bacterium]
MRRSWAGVGLFFCLLLSSSTAAAGGIAWQSDVAEAWGEAVEQQRPLLIFVTRDHCKFCLKMKKSTLVDAQVVEHVEEGFVPLMIDASAEEKLVRELKITAYPTTLIVAPDKTIVERIKGHVTPSELEKRLAEAERRLRGLERREIASSRRTANKTR